MNKEASEDFNNYLNRALLASAEIEPSAEQIKSINKWSTSKGLEAPNFSNALEASAFAIMNISTEHLAEQVKPHKQLFENNQKASIQMLPQPNDILIII